jgi:chorismate dehydratase
LNTVPLVWGMVHGKQSTLFDLQFCVPSECANRLAAGAVDLGIVPVIEMQRQGLDPIPGTGIACRGAVRSILLITKVPFSEIRTLATDSGSRTSVQLARIVLRKRYSSNPQIFSMDPDLEAMLAVADAALLIGDSALRVNPDGLPYRVLDLGQEWYVLTGLPMVFALWAGRPQRVAALIAQGVEKALQESLDFGITQMDALVQTESEARRFPPDLVREYLTRNIRFRIGSEEREGLATYLRLAAELDTLLPSQSAASSAF